MFLYFFFEKTIRDKKNTSRILVCFSFFFWGGVGSFFLGGKKFLGRGGCQRGSVFGCGCLGRLGGALVEGHQPSPKLGDSIS